MTYAFGEFELDQRLFQLRRSDHTVKLEPKIFDVLAYLVAHRDRVVTKDELLEKLWPGEFVSESVLPRCITAARKALGDDAAVPQFIQTVHGRGYRFVAPVQMNAGGSAAADLESRTPMTQMPHHTTFVGREAAMDTLAAGLDAAIRGQGSLILLVGEPGIGKTRTAEQIATVARARSARVATGRCHDGEGAPAFWPWVQILRSCSDGADANSLVAELGLTTDDVVELERPARRDASSTLPPEQARFRLFDNVTRFLVRTAQTRPLVLVLDDLHWADKPSLLLLQFFTRQMRESHILAVATYRDVEVRRQRPLAAVLSGLAREAHCMRVALRGLSQVEVARFIQATAGSGAADAVVAAIHQMTDGNPFFVGEMVRLLAGDDRLGRADQTATLGLTLPQGVRDAIGRRLAVLSAPCNDALRIAAVIGREFDLRTLESVANVPGERLLELLHEADEAGFLSEPAGAVGRYAFAHALVRETLYEEIPTPVRVRLHRRVGEVLEAAHTSDAGPYLAELAHHFFQGALSGDVEPTVRYSVRAAERATRLLAYEEAAGHYERALQALDLQRPADETARCEILLALGDADSCSGERDRSRVSFEHAMEIADALNRPDLFARAALGFGGRGEMGLPRDDRLGALLEQSLEKLGPDSPALRARLLARLVGTVPYSDSLETRMALGTEAVELARRAGDAATLVTALAARTWAMLGPNHIAERLEVATDLLTLAERIGDKYAAFIGHEFRFGALLALGDIKAVDREIDAATFLANEIRQPLYLWFTTWWRASRAICDGRLQEADRLRHEARALGERIQHPGTTAIFEGQGLWLVGERTSLSDAIVPAMRFLLDYYPPASVSLRAGEAMFHAEAGATEEARTCFETLAAKDFADVPRDEHWLVAISQIAELASLLRDQRRAEILYDLLKPFADRNVVHDLLRTYLGSASHYLALLAGSLTRIADASAYFERALAMNARMGALPYVARTQYEYAHMLLVHSAADQRRKAVDLLDQCIAAASALGLTWLHRRSSALREKAGAGSVAIVGRARTR